MKLRDGCLIVVGINREAISLKLPVDVTMTDEKTIVLGFPIPSADPIFLAIVGVHVLFGLAAVITGAVAMFSHKGRGRHSNWGTIYFRFLFGVFGGVANVVGI